jgi:hypothetical protein
VFRYRLTGLLDENDSLPLATQPHSQPFFDGGRANTVAALAELLATPVGTNTREVIVVDPASDPELRSCVAEAEAAVSAAGASASVAQQAEALAAFCAQRLGGRGVTESTAAAHIRDVQRANGHRGVSLGSLQQGVCRHRAVLFKYLCDQPSVGIPCRLVRGAVHVEGTGTGGHAWNVVPVADDGKEDEDENEDDEEDRIGKDKVRADMQRTCGVCAHVCVHVCVLFFLACRRTYRCGCGSCSWWM